MAKRICSVPACSGVYWGRGYCERHYKRWRKYGDPTAGRDVPHGPAIERFWPKVNKQGPIPEYAPQLGACWIWTGAVGGGERGGYGSLWVDGRPAPAHRFSYEALVGPIPDGLMLDHLCRVPACVNPAHLEPVTDSENILRGILPAMMVARHKAKTHCPHGHLYDEANTYITSRGGRKCRACTRESARERYRRKKAARELSGGSFDG